jgi:hypothetical protein
MGTLQINKLSQFHNGETVIFCKTDYIAEDFKYIATLPHNVIFITGNSDYCITDEIVETAPKNIKKWFCQNRLSDSPLLESIPLGLENTIPCKRDGHGYVWPHAAEKTDLLSKIYDVKPSKFLYANFKIETNTSHRIPLKSICQQSDIIDWQEPVLTYPEFMQHILDHEAVICAQGNEWGDNHRIYETLYLKRIPITFHPTLYKFLHHKFPIILCESMQELYQEDLMYEKIKEAKTKSWEWTDYNKWKQLIEDCINEGC